ncbi:hypothetical protein V9T40_003962 [Parthenolecanium corni]|uniref:FP protein C-terminal domain-containing protein n=1 Tax=Parthenolecanium corni TaxID=536013 RepID=A0AAN9Y2Z3_9HEMI
MDEMLKEMKSLRNDIKEKVKQINSTMQELRDQMLSVFKKQDTLQTDMTDLTTENSKLKKQVHKLEQCIRESNVIVTGVPVSKDESIIELVKQIGLKVNVKLEEYDVAIAYRQVQSKRDNTPIIIRMNNWHKKGALVAGSKMQKPTWTINGEEKPIFISEDLTEYTNGLLRDTKLLRSEGRVQFVWVKNGKIFAKATEDSKAVKIEEHEDIEVMRLKFPSKEIENQRQQRPRDDKKERGDQQRVNNKPAGQTSKPKKM